MNSQSIEFDRIKEDSSLPKIVRKSFRIPVEDEKNIWIKINGTRYPLQDICINGAGITVTDGFSFNVGQDIFNCELNCFDKNVKQLNGRIVHISTGFGQGWKYGIEWKGLDKKTADILHAIVGLLKEQLLKNDHQDNDTSD